MNSRRNALKLLLGGGAACLAGAESPLQLQFAPPSARAQTSGRTLIKVFMRGGADGLNLFPPFADNEYYNLRPNLAVAPPNGGDPDSAIGLTNFFGMHPALAPLQEIWDAGDLGVAPATHRTDMSRSHFDNQRWIELGFLGLSGNGYIGRYLEQNTSAVPFQALAAGRQSVPTSMRGPVPVTAVRRETDFAVRDNLWCEGSNCATNNYHAMLNRLYNAAPENASPMERLAYESGRDMADKLGIFEGFAGDYTPDAGGLDYTGDNFGSGLRVAAQLIKADLGLEVVTLDWNIGWDTHSGQLPNGTTHGNLNFGYHNRMNQGATNILAFYRDISQFRNNVAMVFGSEFGRTARQNGSRGTDHGHAAAWFAVGGAVNGGFHGDWPGLTEQQLHRGRFLEQAVDYRDLMGEAMAKFLGAPQSQLSTIFPDHSFSDRGVFSGAVS